MELWLVFGVLCYLSYAISTSIDKYLMNHHNDPLATDTVKMFFDGLILLGVGLIFFKLNFTLELLFWSGILGLLFGLSGLFYFKSLVYKDVEEVVPSIQSLTILFVFFGSLIIFSEFATVYNYLGVFLIILGIYSLLSKNGLTLPKFDKYFWLILAVIFFKIVYILLVKKVLGSVEPINLAILMYFSTASILFVYSIFSRQLRAVFKTKNLYVIPAAIFGALGTLFLYLALSLGDVSKVYPLAGLQSVFIFLFASIFLKEKFTWHRLVGILIIFVGIYLVSL